VVVLPFAHVVKNDDPELRWDWNQIKIDPREVATRIKRNSKSFMFGSATAAHQVEGNNTNNNWYEWEMIPGKIRNGDKSGAACEHYTRYPQDIQLLKNELGVKAYRFSIEWSRIQPHGRRGEWNQAEVAHYHRMIDEIVRQGLTPMITLHHFTNPTWFQNMNSWEHTENVDWFVEFSEFVFKEYSGKVKYWCTFNEVMMYVNIGYIEGRWPPGKTQPQVALNVLQNLLIAHTRVYHKLKTLPNGKESMIGFVKEYTQMDPVPATNFVTNFISRFWNSYTNELILEYFTTGKLQFHVPFIGDLNYTNILGKTSNDYMGLNYYSHNNIFLNMSTWPPIWIGHRPEAREVMTDMGYPVYAEGFYRALKRFGKLGIPVIVTENGCADDKDVLIRDMYIKRYTYALSKAMEDGVDVRGYFFWSFLDNFEWADGYQMRFGLYEVDYKTQKRTLRRGARFFVDLVREFNSMDKK
jgi:beta-glucosidase